MGVTPDPSYYHGWDDSADAMLESIINELDKWEDSFVLVGVLIDHLRGDR